MKSRKSIWIVGAILLVVLIVAGLLLWAPLLSAKTLTEKEANAVALSKYDGEIIKTTKKQDEYQIEMKRKTGVYHLTIDAKSGDVLTINREKAIKPVPEDTPKDQPAKEERPKQLTEKEIKALISSKGELKSIDLIKEADNSYYKAVVTNKNQVITLKIEPYTGEILDSAKETERVITEEDAGKIALQYVSEQVEVTATVDDADFNEPPGQSPYYLVEVELDDGREAIIQVDAYTKTASSVEWIPEDEQDEESDDDDESE